MSDTRAAPWQAASASLRQIAGLLKSETGARQLFAEDKQRQLGDVAERTAHALASYPSRYSIGATPITGNGGAFAPHGATVLSTSTRRTP